MKRSRFTEEQVIAILCEHEVGHKIAVTKNGKTSVLGRCRP